MPDKVNTITIDSIFGGQSEFSAFASKDQFLASHAIDPDQPITDSSDLSYRASGFLRPVPSQQIDSSTTLSAAPMWFVTNPKNASVFVYCATGSVYSVNPSGYTIASVTGLDSADSSGNGAEYYDNYLYLARNGDVARLGPLHSADPVVTTNYWTGTLAKTALSNTTYPSLKTANVSLRNHPMHRHSDGKLYFADVVGNQGYLHYISTTKTTVEGDTNNGSTYQALDFPFGWWPIDIESYGTDLAISLYEGSNDSTTFQKRAKLTFWDTTSANYNKVIDVEFPDPIISALQNVNGVLYTFSGQLGVKGTRVCRFLGGYTFEQIAFIEDSEPPKQGATDALLNKIIFGGTVEYVNSATHIPCVWGIGSKTGKFNGLHNVMGCTSSTTASEITAVKVIEQDGFNFQIPIIGWTTSSTRGIDRQTDDYGRISQIFRSQVYRIGRPFKITKIRVPLCQAVATNMTVVPKVYTDEQSTNYTLTTINSINYPNGERQILFRSDSSSKPLVAKHSFFIEFTWSGTALLTLGLPIIIEYEILDD